jgi:biopolymer transport protein ExbB
MTRSSKSEVLVAVKRACARAASVIHIELSRGTTSLATIASTAPFFGVMGTIMGIFPPFSRGIRGSKVSIMAAFAGEFSKALWPTALGLLVALIAFCGR